MKSESKKGERVLEASVVLANLNKRNGEYTSRLDRYDRHEKKVVMSDCPKASISWICPLRQWKQRLRVFGSRSIWLDRWS